MAGGIIVTDQALARGNGTGGGLNAIQVSLQPGDRGACGEGGTSEQREAADRETGGDEFMTNIAERETKMNGTRFRVCNALPEMSLSN